MSFRIFAVSVINNMNGKIIVKAITAIVFLAVAGIIVFLTINEIKSGVETMGQKGVLAMYAVLFIYAVIRIISLLKNIFSK